HVGDEEALAVTVEGVADVGGRVHAQALGVDEGVEGDGVTVVGAGAAVAQVLLGRAVAVGGGGPGHVAEEGAGADVSVGGGGAAARVRDRQVDAEPHVRGGVVVIGQGGEGAALDPARRGDV